MKMRRSQELKRQLGLTPLQELQTTLKTIQVKTGERGILASNSFKNFKPPSNDTGNDGDYPVVLWSTSPWVRKSLGQSVLGFKSTRVLEY